MSVATRLSGVAQCCRTAALQKPDAAIGVVGDEVGASARHCRSKEEVGGGQWRWVRWRKWGGDGNKGTRSEEKMPAGASRPTLICCAQVARLSPGNGYRE